MSIASVRPARPSIVLAALLLASAPAAALDVQPPRTADALANPHIGYMLWGTTYARDGGADDHYGATLFHIYVPWREVETADQVFDWSGFEARHIDPIVADHPDATFVLRLVADYPGSTASGIDGWYTGGQNERDYPLFLEQPPLSIPATNYTSCNGDGPGRAPAWNHPAFATEAGELIAAFAARYDGDPRITAVQVGLLGLWGEWHQSGCEALAPGDAIKTAVRDAYAAAFASTPLQTRYARDPDAVGVEFGFHEDYFPSFTGACGRFAPPLPLCSDDGDWSLEYGMAEVVPAARDNWRSAPVSGESPFAEQQNVWISRRSAIDALLRDYHFSFLGPAGKHNEPGFAADLAVLARALGYHLHLDRLQLPSTLTAGGSFAAHAELANSGSAPPYHDYRLQLQLLDGSGAVAWQGAFAPLLTAAAPDAPLVLDATFALPGGVAAGTYAVRAHVAGTASGARDIVLQSGPRDGSGRVMLGSVQVVNDPLRVFADGFE